MEEHEPGGEPPAPESRSRRRPPGRRRARTLVSVVAALVLPAGASPPPPGPAPPPDAAPVDVARAGAVAPADSSACAGERFRAFDFWLGAWTVHDREGARIGTSVIRRVAGGCGVREEWHGAEGGSGTSLNFFDPADGSWHQVWVGARGQILRLRGGMEAGRMVLAGDRGGRGVRDRITWEPLEDGRVRQSWHVSRDAGESWERVFTGLYRPADAEDVSGAAGPRAGIFIGTTVREPPIPSVSLQ